MKKVFKRIFFIGFLIFILIQFYQPARNVNNGQVSTLGFNTVYKVPVDVQNILQISCYNCHSNNTNYKWYDFVQPARMLVEMHIKEAKENLNFDEWAKYSTRKQENKLDRMVKQIKVGEMPLPSYTIIHKDAKLTVVQKELIINWINTLQVNKEE